MSREEWQQALQRATTPAEMKRQALLIPPAPPETPPRQPSWIDEALAADNPAGLPLA